MALQRELKSDPKGVARIGRYTPDGDTWDWFGYQLDSTSAKDDWIGISEIAVHNGELLILERDKLNGPDARVKALYRVAIPEGGTAAAANRASCRRRWPATWLPDLQATNGFVQEKVEGVAIAGNQNLYVDHRQRRARRRQRRNGVPRPRTRRPRRWRASDSDSVDLAVELHDLLVGRNPWVVVR